MNDLTKALADIPTFILAAGSSVVSLFAAGNANHLGEQIAFFFFSVLVPSAIAVAAASARAWAKSYAETRSVQEAKIAAAERARDEAQRELAKMRDELIRARQRPSPPPAA